MKNFSPRIIIFASAAVLILAAAVNAQEQKPFPSPAPSEVVKPAPSPTPDPFAGIPKAKPEDVATLDGIMRAIYDVISGDAGQKRNWDRFRSLFYPGAKLIPTGKSRRTGKSGARFVTAEEYITGSSPLMEKDGFFEREIARRTESYGTITHVFSTYESRFKLADKQPFERGINSIQLVNDGSRWWVLNIAWSGETPETPLPEKYLKSAN